MWGLPFGTFLSFIVVAVSVIVAILWGVFSSKEDLEDTRENKK
jgi:hypothetical protein